jgi:GTP-binding protein HflX
MIEQRISLLEKQIEEVHRHRELYRERRRRNGIPVIALVGYTNAGKSSLLNAAAGADVLAEDKLFATLDPTTRQVQLPGGRPVLMTDTVGFIQKLPTQLVAAFRATLEEIGEADLLLHVLDITHPNASQQTQTVIDTLKKLGAGDRPMLTVLNKVDLLEGMSETEVGGIAAEMGLPHDYVAVSALNGWGIATLQQRIEETLGSGMDAATALIPYRRNDLVALWHQQGVIEEERFDAEGTYIVGRIPATLVRQVAEFRVKAQV